MQSGGETKPFHHEHRPVFTHTVRRNRPSLSLDNVCGICGKTIRRPRLDEPWRTSAETLPEPAPPDRINIYVCEKCGGYTTTIDIHRGVTPFTIDCRASGRAGDCRGIATSWGYPSDRPIPGYLPEPQWEWYRPTGKEYDALSEVLREHVDGGGLDLRPRNKK